jgi:hypothetical protein
MSKITKGDYKKLLAQNKTEELIETMLTQLGQYLLHDKKEAIQRIYDAIILLSGKWRGVKQEKLLNIIDDRAATLGQDQISHSILSQVNALPNYYFAYLNGEKNAPAPKTDLRQQVGEFHKDSRFEYDAFLSFSSKDLEEARQVCAELRGYGLHVFLSDEVLKANTGQSFNQKIEQALSNSQHFILLSSVNSMASEWVQIEYETFFNECYIKNKKQRRFIILKGEEFSLQHIPKIYRRLQFAGTPKEILATFVKDQNFIDKQKNQQKQEKFAQDAARQKQAAEKARLELIEREKQAAAQQKAEQARLEQLALREFKAKKKQEEKREKDEAKAAWWRENKNKVVGGILGLMLLVLGIVLISNYSGSGDSRTAAGETPHVKENQDSLVAAQSYQKLLTQAQNLFDKKDFEKAQEHFQNAIAVVDTFNIDTQIVDKGIEDCRAALKKMADDLSNKEKEENYKKWKDKGDRAYKNKTYVSAKEFYNMAKDYVNNEETQQKIRDCDNKIAAAGTAAKTENDYNNYLKKANKHYNNGEYKSAKSDYEKAKTYKNTTEVNNKIADCQEKLKPPKPITPKLPSIIQTLERNMKSIPSGTFTMGCTSEQKDCYDDEEPTHDVSIRGFKMNKHEVTQEEWQAVMGENPSTFKNCDKCPVESVSWNNIQDFLKKLNQLTGKNYRLPSEAEWEYAARGNEKHLYAGSNTIGNIAWYRDNSSRKTHSVGGKSSNGFGLYDMSGNVWEWCQDTKHENYEGAPTDGRAWTSGGSSNRVLRGGGWGNDAKRCRVSLRIIINPDSRNYISGFRLAHS